MQTLLDMFLSLFGEYQPIQVETVIDQTGQVFTYDYVTNWGIIANYIFVGIVLWTVCRCIGYLITGIGKSISV